MLLLQAILVGNLSQYFCEKSSLEEELSAARIADNSTLVNSVEEEIKVVTRNAYLYAAGIPGIAFVVAVTHAWVFYLANVTGMRNRVLLTAFVYEKVWLNLYWYIHCHVFLNAVVQEMSIFTQSHILDPAPLSIYHWTTIYWTCRKPCL